jgi:DNA-binding transcriptional regulator YhcF (GntR family)
VIVIDTGSAVPPFEQVRAQLEAAIAAGTLAPGQRLPSVRQLAADLRLAPGTVARAYAALETAGYVETRRGAGTRVAARGPGAEHASRVLPHARTYVAAARAAGLTLDESLAAIRTCWGDDAPGEAGTTGAL